MFAESCDLDQMYKTRCVKMFFSFKNFRAHKNASRKFNDLAKAFRMRYEQLPYEIFLTDPSDLYSKGPFPLF